MATTDTKPWDAAKHLKTQGDRAAYLEAALEDGDPTLAAAALGDIARAKDSLAASTTTRASAVSRPVLGCGALGLHSSLRGVKVISCL